MCSIATSVDNEWNALSEKELLFRPYRTKYSFINHSRQPNVVLKTDPASHRLYLMVCQDIPSLSELTLDYRLEPLPIEYLKGHGATYL